MIKVDVICYSIRTFKSKYDESGKSTDIAYFESEGALESQNFSATGVEFKKKFTKGARYTIQIDAL